MVKPGFSQAVDVSYHEAEISHAVRLTGELAAGKDLAPEEVNRITESLISETWGGTAGKSAAVPGALATVYACARTAADQGELLGELIAAGPRAQPVLDRIVREAAGTRIAQVLDLGELRSLLESVCLSPKGRVERVATLLASGRTQGEPVENPDSDLSKPSEGLDDRRRAQTRRRDGANSDLEGGSSLPSAKGATTAPARAKAPSRFPEEARLRAALAQGAPAIPGLLDLLRGNADDRELGCTALMHLARDRTTARDVHDSMRRLEADPKLQPIAEAVRREAEGRGGNDRQGIKRAEVADGWLRRAIDSCEPSAILSAAAGREVLAIPLAVRKLVEIRSE